jgi:hypothetical protein
MILLRWGVVVIMCVMDIILFLLLNKIMLEDGEPWMG